MSLKVSSSLHFDGYYFSKLLIVAYKGDIPYVV